MSAFTITLNGTGSNYVASGTGPQADRVASYNVFRNGAKVAEVQVTTYLDEGLVENTEYKYTVSANGKSGIVSALSAETPSAAITAPDVTAPQISTTLPAAN